MAANSKPTSRASSDDESGMYARASRYRQELMEEARALRRSGKIRAARGVESRMQQVEQLIGALEGEGQVGQPSLTGSSPLS
jgi:hypothetical protein